jgi:hypothetical protein
MILAPLVKHACCAHPASVHRCRPRFDALAGTQHGVRVVAESRARGTRAGIAVAGGILAADVLMTVLTALGVTPSSALASAMLRCCAATVKTRTAFSDRRFCIEKTHAEGKLLI